MRLSNSRKNLSAWQTKPVGTSSAFGFDHPKRELRQPVFHVCQMESRKIETHKVLCFGCKLFGHERLPARHGFPVNVTLRLAGHVGTDSRKVVAFSDVRLWPAMGRACATQRQLKISRRFRIHEIGLRGRKFLQNANKTERISTR